MTDKTTTLKLVDDAYGDLRQGIDGLDDAQLTRPWLDGWCVRDIVAHVMGWEREMSGALERIARGERPTPEGVDYSDDTAWNAKFAAALHAVGPRTVIARWEQQHANYVRAAKAVPDDRYGVKDDGKPNAVNRLLETSGYGHYREHLTQISEWRKRESI